MASGSGYGFHGNRYHHSQSSGMSAIFGQQHAPAPPPPPPAAAPPPPPPVLPPLPEQPPRASSGQPLTSPKPNGTLIVKPPPPKAAAAAKPAAVSGTANAAKLAPSKAPKARPAFGSVPERGPAPASSAKTKSVEAARPQKLSEQKYDAHKQANILTTKRAKTAFATLYHEGGVPCRISHGATKMYLQWDKPPQYLPYDALLPAAAEGLLETEHPFVFVSRRMLLEMLEAPAAVDKTVPLLDRIVPHLRIALRSGNDDIYDAALDALAALSRCVGAALNSHLNNIIVPLKRPPKPLQAKVHATLQALDQNGGDQAVMIIKKHLPTYST
eukprot:TRINITY_DN3895_c0_g1_i2.p1 TRINITY_DN3895_c0_g1~~TRINITY_DN3895_c0_g1_i2.p1  ORF type:complete len:328 (+),score=68.97 TRINITY_DN3895_c0_g1_i2:105-1088(+)